MERAAAHAFSSVASFMRMTQRWPPLYGRRAGTPFLPKRFLSENLRMTNACGAAAVDMVRELWLEGAISSGRRTRRPRPAGRGGRGEER